MLHIFYGCTISHNTAIPFFIIMITIVHHIIQGQNYFLGVMHRWNCKYFHKWHIYLFQNFTCHFGSHHFLFIKWSYAKYSNLFYINLILTNGHEMKIQMNFTMIIITVWLFWDMWVIMRGIWFSSLISQLD